MSLVLVVVGAVCVIAAFVMVAANKANDRAGGSGLGKFSIEGPSWIIVLALGLASMVWGVTRWEDRNPPKRPPSTEMVDPEFDTNGEPFIYGDDPELDVLWDGCAVGDTVACDDLYFLSPVDSEYEWFGATCGYVKPEPDGVFCDPSNNYQGD